MGPIPATEKTKHRRQNQDFLFGERAWAEYTHAQLTSFIKGIGIIFLWDPYSQPFTMGFLQMEFWDISNEALVPSMLQGRWHKYLHNDLWRVSDIWWVPPDWTNLCITEAFKIGDSKRSSSLEETIFSSLCYNKEHRWNIIYTFFCTFHVQ